MADDIMMLDQAMDIDSNVPAIPPATNGAPAATTIDRNPLPARRNISNSKENRARLHETPKINPSARIQKTYAPTSTTAPHQAYNTSAAERIKHHGSLRKQQVTRAIADGSFQIIHDTDLVSHGGGDNNPILAPTQDQQRGRGVVVKEQLRRLDADMVAAALFEPSPGMAFDPTAPCAFTSDPTLMADLVAALEGLQVSLARDWGKVVPSKNAAGLLRGFAREVLFTMLRRQRRDSTEVCGVDDGQFWAGVARDFVTVRKLRWLAPRYMAADPKRWLMVGRTESMWDFLEMLLEAVERPGRHPGLIEVCILFFSHSDLLVLCRPLPSGSQRCLLQALGPIGDGMPSFVVAQPSTMQALMSHFETARARYLANLKKNTHGKRPSNNTPFHQTGAAGFGKLARGDDRQCDSSGDEDDAPRRGVLDGGAEDDGQVAEGVPSERGQWFLMKLDEFMASRGGQQQGGVDGDMLSALHLGGAKNL